MNEWNWFEDRGLIVIGRARIRTRSPEGSTVIVIITHNRVLSAVNNNLNDVCYTGDC